MANLTPNKMELKKHVNTIHCSNALTLVERQLYNALLYHAYDDLLIKREHQIPISHLKELIDYGSRDYRKLKQYLKGLMGKVLEWNVIDNTDSDAWVGSTILASAEIKNNICTYQYSDKMSQLLHRPEIYGKLDLLHIAKFRSKFGLALYENCMRYQNISNTSWMTVEVFRKLMGVFGSKFNRFCDLKKYVIEVAVNEVNEISPITISPQYKKMGKSVVELKFDITRKASSVKKNSSDHELTNVLCQQFGFSNEYVEKLFEQYSEEYVQEKLRMVLNSSPYKKGIIRSLSGYLIEALERNYQPNISNTKHKVALKEEREALLKQNNKEEEAISAKYKAYIDEIVRKHINDLSPEKYNELLSDFYEFTKRSKNPMLEKYMKTHGLDHALTEVAFRKYVCEMSINNGTNILSYDSFKKSELLDESLVE